MYAELKSELDMGYKKIVKRREGIEVMEGTSKQSAEGTTHSVRKEEQVAFSNWINRYCGYREIRVVVWVC